MSIVNIPKKHICLTASQDIFAIAKPLFGQYPFSFFDFVRIYKDGNFFAFASHEDFLDHYYKKEYKFLPTINLSSNKGITYHLTNDNPALIPATLDLKERFSMDNFFLLIENKIDYVEVFGFGTIPNFYQPMNFYLNNLDVLEKFILLFKEKAQNIIQLADQNRLTFADNAKIAYEDILALLHCHQKYKANGKLLNKISPIIKDRLQDILYQFNIQLTPQEKNCLIYTFLGMNSKSLSKELNISPRTAQTHLDNIKNKFGVYKKSQLLELFKT